MKSRCFHNSGQALVELVLCTTLILLTMVGAVEISKLIAAQQRLASTVREGGRLYIRHKLDGSSSSDVQSKVITPMLASMVQSGEANNSYTIIISSLIRQDPNADTVNYSTAAQVDDDKIIIEKQYKFVGTVLSPGAVHSSKVGVETSSVATYGGSSNLLELDFLKVGERAALVEVFTTRAGMTALSGLVPGLNSFVLYERGLY